MPASSSEKYEDESFDAGVGSKEMLEVCAGMLCPVFVGAVLVACVAEVDGVGPRICAQSTSCTSAKLSGMLSNSSSDIRNAIERFRAQWQWRAELIDISHNWLD